MTCTSEVLLFANESVMHILPCIICQRDHDECVSVLSGLRLWHSQQQQGCLQGNVLNPVFKDSLRIIVLGGGKSWADQGDSLGPDRHAGDVDSLGLGCLVWQNVAEQGACGFTAGTRRSQEVLEMTEESHLITQGREEN